MAFENNVSYGQEDSQTALCTNSDLNNINDGQIESESEDNVEDSSTSQRTEYTGSSQLPAESIMGIAQSVGATLPEEVAAALAELTMRRVRVATLLALQFSNHEHAEGLRASDFAKAEQILNSPSFGNQSLLPELKIRPIPEANISILDKGPEIDLLATTESPKISDLTIKNTEDPEFHFHQL